MREFLVPGVAIAAACVLAVLIARHRPYIRVRHLVTGLIYRARAEGESYRLYGDTDKLPVGRYHRSASGRFYLNANYQCSDALVSARELREEFDRIPLEKHRSFRSWWQDWTAGGEFPES
jgi:hypothetical protein